MAEPKTTPRDGEYTLEMFEATVRKLVERVLPPAAETVAPATRRQVTTADTARSWIDQRTPVG